MNIFILLKKFGAGTELISNTKNSGKRADSTITILVKIVLAGFSYQINHTQNI